MLPIVALTAAAHVGEREHALAAGMNDFHTKPIDEKRLRQELLCWIGRRRALSVLTGPAAGSSIG